VSDRARDWDKELAEIDRQMAKLPAGGASPAPAGKSAVPAPPAGGKVFTTWLRVALGLVLAAAMTQWPYVHDCGLNLAFYLLAILTVVVAGVWSGISSWYRRMGLAHSLSLLVLLWGLFLAARETLPRVGYAKVSATWLCP
jgi:hypothetical protein